MGYISVGWIYCAGDVVNGRRTDGNCVFRNAVHTLAYIVQCFVSDFILLTLKYCDILQYYPPVRSLILCSKSLTVRAP
jgi:hypothetical protein